MKRGDGEKINNLIAAKDSKIKKLRAALEKVQLCLDETDDPSELRKEIWRIVTPLMLNGGDDD